MTQSTVRYNDRRRPGVQAERVLLAQWDRGRWIWNQAVDVTRDQGRRLGTASDVTAAKTIVAQGETLLASSETVRQGLLPSGE